MEIQEFIICDTLVYAGAVPFKNPTMHLSLVVNKCLQDDLRLSLETLPSCLYMCKAESKLGTVINEIGGIRFLPQKR